MTASSGGDSQSVQPCTVTVHRQTVHLFHLPNPTLQRSQGQLKLYILAYINTNPNTNHNPNPNVHKA